MFQVDSLSNRHRDHRYRVAGFGAMAGLATVVAGEGWLIQAAFGLLWPWVAWFWQRWPKWQSWQSLQHADQQSAGPWLQRFEAGLESGLTGAVLALFSPIAALALGGVIVVAHVHAWGFRVLGVALASCATGWMVGVVVFGFAPVNTAVDSVAVVGLVVGMLWFAQNSHALSRHLDRARKVVSAHASAQTTLNERMGRYLPQDLRRRLQQHPHDAPSLERRWLTVTFVDWVGFTELSERLSETELRDRMNGYLCAVEYATVMHPVSIAKYLGDGVLLVSGADGARTAGANAAVDVARALLQSLCEQGIRVRIGIASGDCTVGDWGDRQLEYSMVGRPVNLASRLQARAGTNEIWICASTRALVGGSGRTLSWRRHWVGLKGLGKIEAYQWREGK